MTEGTICGLSIQEAKGKPSQEKESLELVEGKGILGDRHYGETDMQVCLLEQECRTWMEEQEEKGLCFGRFRENIRTCSADMSLLARGDRLWAGDALLEITQAGKECFPECPRLKAGKECRLRHACSFAKVLKGGNPALGDALSLAEHKQDGDRYIRQLGLKGFGPEGQERLRKAKILVIGAGGLGCPAITALAEAGAGAIGIADGDTAALSNLNRQFLYTPEDIGKPKAECAARWVKRFRPDCRVKTYSYAFGREELQREAQDYDFILSCVDSIETRFQINEFCRTFQIPFADGAIDGMYGTVQAVFSGKDPCLSCMNPKKLSPKRESISFGSVTMVTGTLEAHLALKYLSAAKKPQGGLYSFDGESMTLEEIPAVKNPACTICNKK